MSVRSEQRRRRVEWVKNIAVFIVTFAVICVLFYFIRFPVVDGDSMLPTYRHGDRLVMLRTSHVKQNDVAVLYDSFYSDYIVKRVIGTGGDHVAINEDGVSVNGVFLDEPYLLEQDWFKPMDKVNIIVPEDAVYVLGDNRKNSADSRIFGVFYDDVVFGRILFDLS